MMKLKVSEVCDPPVGRIFETTQGTRLTLPPKMDENSYITDIEIILNFVQANELTVKQAMYLFQDATDMLEYHKYNFENSNIPTPIKANGQQNSKIKFAMYQEHDYHELKYDPQYKLFSAEPFAYFEMLLQLNDFIAEQGLTIKQAQNLYSDCIKMLFESK